MVINQAFVITLVIWDTIIISSITKRCLGTNYVQLIDVDYFIDIVICLVIIYDTSISCICANVNDILSIIIISLT